MARIDGVFNNFASHVTSGLSGFIPAAYEACARAGLTRLHLQVFPEEIPAQFAADPELAVSVRHLREKFEEILAKESQMPLGEVARLGLDVDFAPDKSRVEERRRALAAIPVHYGADPVFHCTVAIRLLSGVERKVDVQNLGSIYAKHAAEQDAADDVRPGIVPE